MVLGRDRVLDLMWHYIEYPYCKKSTEKADNKNACTLILAFGTFCGRKKRKKSTLDNLAPKALFSKFLYIIHSLKLFVHHLKLHLNNVLGKQCNSWLLMLRMAIRYIYLYGWLHPLTLLQNLTQTSRKRGLNTLAVLSQKAHIKNKKHSPSQRLCMH